MKQYLALENRIRFIVIDTPLCQTGYIGIELNMGA